MNEFETRSVFIHSASGRARQAARPWFEEDPAATLIDKTELSREDIKGIDIEAALHYWDDVRGDSDAPERDKFKIENLPPKLIPSISIIDFDSDPLDFYYRFFGSNMVRVAGMELTGKYYYADNIQGYGYISAELLPLMAERRAPLITVSRWQSIRDLTFETTSARLPLVDAAGKVVSGVTVSSWKQSP